jgi:hypothetical protein
MVEGSVILNVGSMWNICALELGLLSIQAGGDYFAGRACCFYKMAKG